AAHAVDLIVSDGPRTYRLQIKTVATQDESSVVQNAWKDKHIDYVIYFAQRSNWGYVCPAFNTNRKQLNSPSHKRFLHNRKDFLTPFHACKHEGPTAPTRPPISFAPPPAPLSPPNT